MLVNKGLISIIIPTFNRAELVVRAVRSALDQDYPYKQIIVVDDGSTDDTRERLSEFPQIEYHWQENQGQAAARNHGLKFARGEFLVSLDSDDFWHPCFLSRSLTALTESDLGFAFSFWEPAGPNEVRKFRFDRRTRILEILRPYEGNNRGNWHHLTPTDTRALFIRHCCTASSGLLLRHRLIDRGWNPRMRVSDDWMLLMDIVLRHQPACAFTEEVLWTKWQDGTNILDHEALDAARRAANEVHDNEIILQELGPLMTPAERRILRHRLARCYSDVGYHASQDGRLGTTLTSYWSGLCRHPSGQLALETGKAVARGLLSQMAPGRRHVSKRS